MTTYLWIYPYYPIYVSALFIWQITARISVPNLMPDLSDFCERSFIYKFIHKSSTEPSLDQIFLSLFGFLFIYYSTVQLELKALKVNYYL